MHIVQAKRHRGLLRVNFENHFLLTLHCTLLSSSETRCLWSICLMKLARKILQNLPYLWDKKFQIFLIHLDCWIPRLVCYRFIYSENMAYGELDNFIKYKPLKLCNVFCYIFCTLWLTYRAMCSLWSILLMLGVY